MDLTKPAKLVEDKLDAWAGRRFEWHKWFAILPVFTENDELLWLEWVETKLQYNPWPWDKRVYRKLKLPNS